MVRDIFIIYMYYTKLVANYSLARKIICDILSYFIFHFKKELLKNIYGFLNTVREISKIFLA